MKKRKEIEAFCILLIVTLLLIFLSEYCISRVRSRKGASCTPSAMDGIAEGWGKRRSKVLLQRIHHSLAMDG